MEVNIVKDKSHSANELPIIKNKIERPSLQKDIRGLLRRLSKRKTENYEINKLWLFQNLQEDDIFNPFRKISLIEQPIEDLLPLWKNSKDDATPKFITKSDQKDCKKKLLKFDTIHEVKEY